MEFPLESSGIPLESSGIQLESSGISTDSVEFPLEPSGNSSGLSLFQWEKVPFISLELVEFHVNSSGISLIFSVGICRTFSRLMELSFYMKNNSVFE